MKGGRGRGGTMLLKLIECRVWDAVVIAKN